MAQDFLVHAQGDSVGVAVKDLTPDQEALGRFQDDGSEIDLTITDDVPLGHKIALDDIAAGAPIIKYGVRIGKATTDIGKGHHVHVHNLKGERWA